MKNDGMGLVHGVGASSSDWRLVEHFLNPLSIKWICRASTGTGRASNQTVEHLLDPKKLETQTYKFKKVYFYTDIVF